MKCPYIVRKTWLKFVRFVIAPLHSEISLWYRMNIEYGIRVQHMVSNYLSNIIITLINVGLIKQKFNAAFGFYYVILPRYAMVFMGLKLYLGFYF